MSADVHALAGAYALDALPADERAFFERHLSMCGACRAEGAELTETAARLGSAAAQAPPPDLRARILAAADVTRQLPPEPDPTPAEVLRPRRSQQRWLAPVAACLALAVVVLSGAIVAIGQRGTEPGQQPALVAVLGAPDLQTAELEMEGPQPGRFLYSPEQDRGVLVAASMPAVSDDKTYELWLIHDGTPQPAGLFRPGTDGKAIAHVNGIVRGAELVAITVEPASGSERPTGEVLASAEL
jgi:anti-sigma-K factor RskA